MPAGPTSATLGVVTGLAGEAGCLSSTRAQVACAGADSGRARAEAQRLVAAGCEGLVSFGLAGGLDPALPSGALVIASAIVAPDGAVYPADQPWRRRLIASLGERWQIAEGSMAGAVAAVGGPGEKRAVFARTRAVAVDMESLAVAEVARAYERPLLIIRAIADPAARQVPVWLDGVIAPDGRTRLGAVLAGLAAHPGDVVALCRLGADARRGMAALRGVAALAGPLLAFDA